MKSENKKHFYLFVLAPLLVACFIYVSFRSENILVNLLIEESFLENVFHQYRKIILPLQQFIPHTLTYSLPSALWLFSTLNFFLIVWKFNINRSNFYWFLLPSLYCFSLEILQRIHFTDGTYDTKDLIFYALSILSFISINKKSINDFGTASIQKKHLQSALTLSVFLGIVILSDCF